MAQQSGLDLISLETPYNREQTRIGRMYERSRKAREARLIQLEGATGTPGNTTASPQPTATPTVGQSGIAAILGAGQVRPRWQDALTRILGSPAPPPVPPAGSLGSTLLSAGTTVPNFNLGQRGRRNAAQQLNYSFLSGFNP